MLTCVRAGPVVHPDADPRAQGGARPGRRGPREEARGGVRVAARSTRRRRALRVPCRSREAADAGDIYVVFPALVELGDCDFFLF